MHSRAHTSSLFLGRLDKVINDGIQQDSGNTNGASEQLDGVKRLAQDESNTDNDNNSLGRVGDRLRDGSRLLERHGGNFIVSVEPETRGGNVGPDGRGGLDELGKLTHAASFLHQDNGDAHEETKNGGKSKLVSDRSDAVLESSRLHELLVFVTLDGSKHVGNACRNECGPCKVEFLDGSEDDSSDNNGEAPPLGLGDWLSVDELGEDGGKGRLGGLDDLGKADGSGSHGEPEYSGTLLDLQKERSMSTKHACFSLH